MNPLLLTYIELLKKWNKAYNLTAIETDQDMMDLHLADSLSILPYLKGNRVIDIGTGAGFPGIPLSIESKEKHFTLLDKNSKKTRFLIQVKHKLALHHVDVVQSRAEEFCPSEKYDTVVCRALSRLKKITEISEHLLKHDGIILAMKGIYPEDELTEVKEETPFEIQSVQRLEIPNREVERHAVILSKRAV